jgi:hypothetical protein
MVGGVLRSVSRVPTGVGGRVAVGETRSGVGGACVAVDVGGDDVGAGEARSGAIVVVGDFTGVVGRAVGCESTYP